ncbi:hypothetical protein [Subtercola sp. YIM 133946]|uniref:hypothetical protein n=1 Tax=Subtercola sp. YIM 133946 TaxID=3118909 RepID=UPI002F935B81
MDAFRNQALLISLGAIVGLVPAYAIEVFRGRRATKIQNLARKLAQEDAAKAASAAHATTIFAIVNDLVFVLARMIARRDRAGDALVPFSDDEIKSILLARAESFLLPDQNLRDALAHGFFVLSIYDELPVADPSQPARSRYSSLVGIQNVLATYLRGERVAEADVRYLADEFYEMNTTGVPENS